MSLSELDEIPDKMDDLITEIRSGGLINAHFFPQSHFLGNRSQYTDIWAMSDFDAMLKWLEKATRTSKRLHQIHTRAYCAQNHYGEWVPLFYTQNRNNFF